MVDGVAREFDLGDNTTCGVLPVPAPSPNLDSLIWWNALRSLAGLAESLARRTKN